MLALRGDHRLLRVIESALPYPLQRINDVTYATTVKHLSSAQVRAIRVAVPDSAAELRALVEFLDRETAEIDAFITDQEELIGLLAERRDATISHAVTKGLDPTVPMKASGIPWLGKVPDSWTTRPLWTLFKRIKGVGHPDEQMLSVFREFGVVVKDDHDNNNQTAENRNIYQLVGPGWLVTNRMKAWQGSVGISDHRGIVSGHYLCFEPVHSESSKFMNHLFRSLPYAAGYATLSRGVRIGQAEIDNDHYRLLPVLLPPLREQLEIAEHIDREVEDINAALADAREAIALSRERRGALISAAVTGKIDVREQGVA
jgi:type I restriction enzyme S subunit